MYISPENLSLLLTGVGASSPQPQTPTQTYDGGDDDGDETDRDGRADQPGNNGNQIPQPNPPAGAKVAVPTRAGGPSNAVANFLSSVGNGVVRAFTPPHHQ